MYHRHLYIKETDTDLTAFHRIKLGLSAVDSVASPLGVSCVCCTFTLKKLSRFKKKKKKKMPQQVSEAIFFQLGQWTIKYKTWSVLLFQKVYKKFLLLFASLCSMETVFTVLLSFVCSLTSRHIYPGRYSAAEQTRTKQKTYTHKKGSAGLHGNHIFSFFNDAHLFSTMSEELEA